MSNRAASKRDSSVLLGAALDMIIVVLVLLIICCWLRSSVVLFNCKNLNTRLTRYVGSTSIVCFLTIRNHTSFIKSFVFLLLYIRSKHYVGILVLTQLPILKNTSSLLYGTVRSSQLNSERLPTLRFVM